MPFAAALSQHPVAAHAVGEVAGQVIEDLGADVDLAVLFASPHHTGALDDVASALRTLLRPGAFIGCTNAAVIGGGREVEHGPALTLWTARLPGSATPVRLTIGSAGSPWEPDDHLLEGLDVPGTDDARSLVVLADPFTFPTGAALAEVARVRPQLRVIGGLASAAQGPGGNRLVLDDHVVADGAVGVLLDAAASPTTVVSQGCRPIGQAFTVTRAERNVIYELGGRPALDRLLEMIEALPQEDRVLAGKGLHAGIVIDEHKADFERGDFLVRNVLGADRSVGAVAVGDEVTVGSTVQFQVRDAASADDDLHELLAGERADGALVFTCTGRGEHLFGRPDHDASLVEALTGTRAVAGMFSAGELGPVGGRNHLHTFTASVALFHD